MSRPFKLYDLKVDVIGNPTDFVCNHKPGIAFTVSGENIIFTDNNSFSMYALAALIPLFPVKQRQTDENDWISTEELIACPDPNCGARFKIMRNGTAEFTNEDATKPLRDRGSD